MSTRLSKQLMYGFFYLVVLFLIVFGMYRWFFVSSASCFDGRQNQNEEGVDCGGVCSQVCTEGVLPITSVGSVFYGFPDAAHIELLAKVQNSNSGLAAENFQYVFRIHKTDGTTVDVGGSSFLYADDVKYISEIGGVPPGIAASSISQVEFIAESFSGDSVVWVKSGEFQKPLVKLRDSQVGTANDVIQVSGHVGNDGTLTVPSLEVAAVFYDRLGQVVGVSRTTLDALGAGEVRAFTITHPVLAGAQLDATVISISPEHP